MRNWCVPKEILIPVGQKWNKKTESCCDNWDTEFLSLVRSDLPEKYRKVPLMDLKTDLVRLRKGGNFKDGREPARKVYYTCDVCGHSNRS